MDMVERKILTDEEIAVRILALEEGEMVDVWLEKWSPVFSDWGKADHSGGCTNVPWTCLKCMYDSAMSRVPDYRRLLGGAIPPLTSPPTSAPSSDI